MYNPVSFLKKYDRSGKFIRKYLPALKNFPEKYIYEPWKASTKEQSRARCVIGVDYPFRVVTEKEIEEIFQSAKRLLKKNHNIDLDLKKQSFKIPIKTEKFLQKSEDNFTLKDRTQRPNNKKFRISMKESTRIESFKNHINESEELLSSDRIIFRKNDMYINQCYDQSKTSSKELEKSLSKIQNKNKTSMDNQKLSLIHI